MSKNKHFYSFAKNKPRKCFNLSNVQCDFQGKGHISDLPYVTLYTFYAYKWKNIWKKCLLKPNLSLYVKWIFTPKKLKNQS